MPTYVIYNKANGDIVHVHREFYMGSEEPVEIDQERMMRELHESLPQGLDLGVLTTTDPMRPVRGYQFLVDLASARPMCVERPRADGGTRK